MTDHHPIARIYASFESSDDTPQWNSIQNKHEYPDVEGRSEILDSMVPEQYDKEIYRIDVTGAFEITGLDDADVDPITYSITRSRSDRGAGLDAASTQVNPARPDTELESPAIVNGWAGDIHQDGNRQMVTFRETYDLTGNPAEWPVMDLYHMRAWANFTSHNGGGVQADLHWRPL